MRISVKSIMVSVLVGVVVYAVIVALSGFDQILAAIVRLNAAHWGLILGLSLVNYALRFGRWHWYMVQLGHAVPLVRHGLFYLAGFALTATPGKAGETVRGVYLKPYGVGYGHSLAAFFAERFLDLLAIALLAGLATSQLAGYEWLVVAMGLLLLACLPLIRSAWLPRQLRAWGQRLPWARLRPLPARLAGLLESSARLLQSGVLLGGLAISLLGWGAEGLGFYYISKFLGCELAPEVAVGIYSIGVLVGVISFLPGGLGSTEAVMGGMLVWAGLGPQDAVAATLICRLATLWFAVAVGLGAMGLLQTPRLTAGQQQQGIEDNHV